MKTKLIIFVAFVLLASGCVTQKRCNTKFPPQIITVTKDSIRTEIQYRDTTIFIKLPVEKVTVFDTIFIKNGVIQYKEIKAQTNYATARSWIGQNRINLELTDKDTTLIIRLNNALKIAKYWEVKATTETKILPPEKFIPKWIKILAWFGAAFIILTILFLVRKFV
jgi:hypothetical protein